MRVSALRFLYKRTVKRRDLAFDDLFPKVPHKLPTMILVLLYATGERRTEASQIKVEDIDSQRMVIHIRQGKGARDRDMPLSRSCSKNCAADGGGRARVAISFPALRACGA